jgi:hypothetical protein
VSHEKAIATIANLPVAGALAGWPGNNHAQKQGQYHNYVMASNFLI